MESERWRRIESLFHTVLSLEPRLQGAFLDEVCAADVALRREVESLLANGARAESFLESHAPQVGHPATRAVQPGQTLGPYRIDALLGDGGMGEVYRAHDSKLARDVALKFLPVAFAGDPERMARFRHEARVLASLNHPNIGAIYGLEELEGATCLVLELVEGETLSGPLPVDKALHYASQIAEALEAAHEKGIVHRDLKPGNVKVTPLGQVKVLDFGLAKAAKKDDRENLFSAASPDCQVTQAGQIVGTPPYLSPEQARGESVDQRTDVWAFGCVLYELLSGKRAFAGETLSATIATVLEREPDWTVLPAKTPAKVRSLLRRCLEKNVHLRLASIRNARERIATVQRGFISRRQLAILAAAAVAIIAVATGYLRRPARPAPRSEWVQLTDFPDQVGQPALSPDGRMLTFVRGIETFATGGEIYVKYLPDGNPVQLTRDGLRKMSPLFSPDNSRIAYTVTTDGDHVWDTWAVPSAGGQARPWLSNASGLVWLNPRRILFSEIKTGIHMGIVTAEENRAGASDVYLPVGLRSMAHRSFPSPDGKWAVLVEMDRGNWIPCRLVPLDGSSGGQQIGPAGGACTFAGWSPDGAWIYLSSSVGGRIHTWRQRFPDGEPEQVTSGPTEEEGIAMAPDGRSFVTSVALRQSVVFIHGPTGDRQISREGYSIDPKFTPDGKKLCYRILKGSMPSFDSSELRIVDLDSGDDRPLMPDLDVFGQIGLAYDISPDGKVVVAAVRDRNGKGRFWLAALDRQSPPSQIPGVEGDFPHFGPAREIFFRLIESPTAAFVYRVNQDGAHLRKILDHPVTGLRSVSPDGQWIVARIAAEKGTPQMAFPLNKGLPLHVSTGRAWCFDWSRDQKLLYISEAESSMSMIQGRTYVIPLSPGNALPAIPKGGFQSFAELAKLPGAHLIQDFDVAPGPVPGVYAFSRASVQRNLYRIPID